MINSSAAARPRTEPAIDNADPPAQPVDHNRLPTPVLRQPRQDDDTAIGSDSDDDATPATHLAIRREWQEDAVEASEQSIAEPSAPEPKQPRAAAPKPAPVPIITLSRQHHPELLELVRKHGGQVRETKGNVVTLTLPPDSNLDFRVDAFCLRNTLLNQQKPFPGDQAFADNLAAEFAACLKAASNADRADQVRALLATNLGHNAGPLIREIVQSATQAGAAAAVDVLTDTSAYWIDGVDISTTGWPSEIVLQLGGSDQAPSGWQSQVRPRLSDEEIQAFRQCVRQGDYAAALSLLFEPDQQPDSGKFFILTFGCDFPGMDTLLQACGAAMSFEKNGFTAFALASTDFNRDALRGELLMWQQESRSGPIQKANTRPHCIAALWGDADIFTALWRNESHDWKLLHTPEILGAAASSGAEAIIDILLPELPDLDKRSYYFGHSAGRFYGNAVDTAAASGFTHLCAKLLSWSNSFGNAQALADNALEHAARSGHTEICALLLTMGADPDSPENSFPLLEAARAGHAKTCQLLVNAGASLDEFDGEGDSVLSLAAGSGQIQLYEFLRAHGASRPPVVHAIRPLTRAVQNNQSAMVSHLLALGEPIESVDTAGRTPLMHACQVGAEQAIALLLDSGANIWPLDSGGDSALTLAVSSKNPRAVAQLLQRLPQNPPTLLMPALLAAIQRNQPEMVRMLVDRSPLNPHEAGLSRAYSPLLCLSNPDINDDTDGSDDAVAPRHQVLSILLSQKNIPRHHVTQHGQDALMLAIDYKDAIAVEMMVNAGLRVGQVDTYGHNAITYAFSKLDQTDKHTAGRILRAIAQSLLSMPYRKPLLDDLALAETDPIKRDLATFLAYASSVSTVDIAELIDDEINLMSRMQYNLVMQPAASANPRTPATYLQAMVTGAGIPSAMHARLIAILRELPQIREGLLGDGTGSAPGFQAAINGIYLTLEPELDALASKFAAHYSDLRLDDEWQAALTKFADDWLRKRFTTALEHEATQFGPLFGELFSVCEQSTLAGRNLATALTQPAPAPGQVSTMLMQAGVYAPLAQRIDLCWRTAWEEAAGTLARRAATADASPANTLLSAFRATLKAEVDTVSVRPEGTNLMQLDGSSPAAAKLYADLMYRQLHMLTQFINSDDAQPL